MTSGITAPCICRGIMKYIPKLANAKIVRTWAGYEDVCIDGVPVLGNVDEVPGADRGMCVYRAWIWNFTDCGKIAGGNGTGRGDNVRSVSVQV